MKRVAITLLLCLLPIAAWAQGFPWRDHAAPFNFLFDNEIDTHQQSIILGTGDLQGWLYVVFTENGRQRPDAAVPMAMHADCESMPEACTAGWALHGVPMEAVYIGMGDGFPLWCLAGDPPVAPGYSHFHWTGEPETAAGLVPGEVYSGFLLKLTAVDTFMFHHMGGHQNPVLVTPGIDAVSHANIVTDCLPEN